MIKRLFIFGLLSLFVISMTRAATQAGISFDAYHNNKEVQQILSQLQKGNPASTKLHSIATSPGGEPITILEIGSNKEGVPAIFVGANFEGNIPLSTEGALRFAQMLLDSSEYTQNVKWYIMPNPNPDAAAGFFSTVKSGLTVNKFEINNDADEAVNEDDYDDLNGDGVITQMRVKDLQGTYIVSKKDARLLDRANSSKGERGEYKIYSEGLDNDGDGEYNEDGVGGINIGISFPHLFPHEKKEAGLWSGQSPETYGILRFIFDRPEIAMIYTLGSTNFCLTPPKGGRKGGADLQNIKIQGRYARMFGVDPGKTFSMDEVIEMTKALVPAGTEVTPSMVAGFLGLGAAVNPLDEDLKFYTKLSEDYKKYLEAKKFNTERLDAPGDKDGSFELWAYYHLGVPSFSMNLFTVPKVKEEKKKEGSSLSLEDVEKMSTDEFVALGEEKIDTFLKANNAPGRFKASGVIEMMKSGKFTPKQMAGMMKNMPKKEKDDELSEKDQALLAWSDKEWDGKGYVNWEKYTHPTLGEVEIGGYVPYLETTPKPEMMDSLFSAQLPWLLQLSTKLPEIEFADEKVTELGNGIYKLELYIENNGYLSYPIAMGQRNSHPAPVVIILKGDGIEFLEGIQRTPLGSIEGNHVKKLTWLIKADKQATINATIESKVFGSKMKQVKIGG
ncbi:MAG: M14 family metallopeptidase [Draconibacterium sp.]